MIIIVIYSNKGLSSSSRHPTPSQYRLSSDARGLDDGDTTLIIRSRQLPPRSRVGSHWLLLVINRFKQIIRITLNWRGRGTAKKETNTADHQADDRSTDLEMPSPRTGSAAEVDGSALIFVKNSPSPWFKKTLPSCRRGRQGRRPAACACTR